jgi:hypothetical protein
MPYEPNKGGYPRRCAFEPGPEVTTLAEVRHQNRLLTRAAQ